MIVQNPPIIFITLGGLASRAGVNRRVPARLIGQALVVPAAFVEIGNVPQPLFRPEQAVDVLKHAQLPRHVSTKAQS